MVAANPRGRGRAMKEMKEKGNGEMGKWKECFVSHDIFNFFNGLTTCFLLLLLTVLLWCLDYWGSGLRFGPCIYTLYCLATHAIWQCHPALALCFIVLAVFVCIYIYIIINLW